MRFETRMMREMMIWSGAGVMGMCGSAAFAQSAGGSNDTERVVVVSPDAGGNVTIRHSTSSTMTNEAGDSVQIRIEGVDAEVFVNGTRVGGFKTDGDWVEQSFGDGDAEVFVRKQPGGVLVIEQDGSTMKVGTRGMQGGRLNWVGPSEMAFTLAPDMNAFAQGFNTARFFGEEQPKVMLGVTMTAPSEDQVREFGLDPDKVTVFGTVIEGLPAAKAGLKGSDIVVGVDGLDDASQKMLREKLMTLEPGQTLTLEVVRDGGVEEIDVQLEAYDSERLGVPAQLWFGESLAEDDARLAELRAQQEETRRELELAMQRSLNADGQAARDRAAEEASRLNARLQDLTTQVAKRMSKRATERFFQNQAELNHWEQVAPQVMNDHEGNVIVIPSPPAPAWDAEPLRERLNRSEALLRERDARVQELESRLDAMSEKMAHLEALLMELRAGSGDE